MEEIVLYHRPDMPGKTVYTDKIKGVLVQMGVKIKNLTPSRWEKTVGLLAGVEEAEPEGRETAAGEAVFEEPFSAAASAEPEVTEEFLVICGFTQERLDLHLERLKAAGVPRTVMKAVLTQTNARWTVSRLYWQMVKERIQMETQKRKNQ